MFPSHATHNILPMQQHQLCTKLAFITDLKRCCWKGALTDYLGLGVDGLFGQGGWGHQVCRSVMFIVCYCLQSWCAVCIASMCSVGGVCSVSSVGLWVACAVHAVGSVDSVCTCSVGAGCRRRVIKQELASVSLKIPSYSSFAVYGHPHFHCPCLKQSATPWLKKH